MPRKISPTDMILIVAAVAGVVLFLTPDPDGAPAGVMHAGAVVLVTIAILATARLPEFLGALIFFLGCVALAIAPPEVVFSGFLSKATWMLFGGLVIGLAVEETGLGKRLAARLMRSIGGGYAQVIFGTVWLAVGLSFLVPAAVGRIVILLPILMALAKRMGFAEGSRGRAGIVMAMVAGTTIPSFGVLPSNVPNMVMSGAAETLYGIQILYGEYFLLHFPVLGVTAALAIPTLILLLFRAEPVAVGEQDAIPEPDPRQRRLAAIMLAALALWVTDTLHGISPAWVSLGAAVLCALPGIGVLESKTVMNRLNLGPMFFLAGVIGIGAVVTSTGLGREIGEALIAVLPFREGETFQNFASLIGLGVVMGWFTTLPGQPAIMSALAETLSQATGLPLLTVLMAQVPGWAMTLFPYQAPPLLVTFAMSGIGLKPFLRLLLPLFVFQWIVMVPLQFFWWQLLGYLP